MLRRNDLQEISLNLNEAVLDSDHWGHGLQYMADVFRGSFATFEIIDKRTGRHIQHYDSSDFEIQDKYLNHYMPLNPRIAFGNRAQSPAILHDQLFIDEDGMDRNEFYADFLKPHDLRYFLSIKAYETAGEIGVFTVQKNASSGPPTSGELTAINELAPSLRRIADLQVQYSHFFARLHELDSVIAASNDAIVLLDEFGQIKEMNAAAEDILNMHDGMKLHRGQLQFQSNTNRYSYEQLIGLYTSDQFSQYTKQNIAESILIQRPSGLPPYRLRVQNISGTQNGYHVLGAKTVLFIEDPCKGNRISIEQIMSGFGLSQAEANVALLITEGKTAQEIASLCEVSMPTVRTHIQRIMHKMSVNKQLDIARILARYF